MKIVRVILIIASILTVQCFENACNKISLSTNITSSKSDVVYNGEVKASWIENSESPILTQTSLEFDFFYLTVVDTSTTLQSKDIKLFFDDHFFADSSVELKHVKNLGSNINQYTIMIKYRCKQYGGALINYEMDLNVPNCGMTKVFWKKICGNPLVARQGLSMDIQVKKFNQTIVTNGLLTNASYFDSDLDNFVFKVPKNQDKTYFYIYMDMDDNTDYAEKLNTEADEFGILRDVLMLIPEERVDSIFVDADAVFLNPYVSGDLVNGGLISRKKSLLTLEFNCLRYGQSWIQLSIPLLYFRDINLFFIKECPHQYFWEFLDVTRHMGFVAFMILLGFLGCIGATLYNVTYKGQQGIDSVPFLVPFLQWLMGFQMIRDNKLAEFITNNLLQSRFKLDDDLKEMEGQDIKEQKDDNKTKYGSL